MSRELVAIGVSIRRVAERIRDGMDATKPVVGRDADGAACIVGEVPDHRTRFPFVEMAANAHGMLQNEAAAGEESYELRVLKYRRQA